MSEQAIISAQRVDPALWRYDSSGQPRSRGLTPARYWAFLGHNGAGKTTAVRLLNGVLAPSSGRMQVLGFDPVQQGPRVAAAHREC